MKQVKTSLKNSFKYDIRIANETIKKTELLQQQLETINFRKATYKVNLRSMWENEGEPSTETIYIGTIKNAISAAEAEFKRKNNRSDVQAWYTVYILIGEAYVNVPSACWKDYKENIKEVNPC